jgi:hypothetical protein
MKLENASTVFMYGNEIPTAHSCHWRVFIAILKLLRIYIYFGNITKYHLKVVVSDAFILANFDNSESWLRKGMKD